MADVNLFQWIKWKIPQRFFFKVYAFGQNIQGEKNVRFVFQSCLVVFFYDGGSHSRAESFIQEMKTNHVSQC